MYIEHMPNSGFGSVMTHWIWRKLNDAGRVTVHGSHHGSLEACFASARKHRDAFGNAPIIINLHKGDASDAPAPIVLPDAQHDISIASKPLH
ncbi:MAG: hypothetical protein WC729_24495 [Sphingomonas sp.]